MTRIIVAQGAEAILTRDGETLVKERIKKGYRIHQLDSVLREKRTKLEERTMRAARRAGVAVPQIIDVGMYVIKMQFIDGKKLREFSDISAVLADKVGENIAKLHRNDIIHGDLTTSNMILNDDKVWFIDFGLSFVSKKVEDKAVDLQLLKQALVSTHTNAEQAWQEVLKSYSINYNESAGVLQRLHTLEKRGRYKRGKH